MDSNACISPLTAASLCIEPGLKAGAPFGFHKSEKLRLRSLVNDLFDRGESLYVYPLRLVWRPLSQQDLASTFRRDIPAGIGRVQFLVTIPKKRCRHAVDRVRMRRLVREAYRLHRLCMAAALEARPDVRSLSLAFIFTGNRPADSEAMERAVRKLLAKLSRRLVPDSETPSETDSEQCAG